MMRWTILAAAAALTVASPASAQAARTADFMIGTVRYSVPVPAGYCVPESAEDIRTAQYAASLDKDNVTLLTLLSCGARADPLDYLVIKSPATLVGVQIRRADILADATFATPEKNVAMNHVEKELEGAFSEVTGKDVQVSMAINARGHDDVCGYVGGAAKVEAGADKTLYISAGACISSVGDRAISVNYYAPGNDPATAKRLMENARAFLLTIIVRK